MTSVPSRAERERLGVVRADDVRPLGLVLELLDDRAHLGGVHGLVEVQVQLAPDLPERREAQRPGDEAVGHREGDLHGVAGLAVVLDLHPQEARAADAAAGVPGHDGRVQEEKDREQEQGVDGGTELFHGSSGSL